MNFKIKRSLQNTLKGGVVLRQNQGKILSFTWQDFSGKRDPPTLFFKIIDRMQNKPIQRQVLCIYDAWSRWCLFFKLTKKNKSMKHDLIRISFQLIWLTKEPIISKEICIQDKERNAWSQRSDKPNKTVMQRDKQIAVPLFLTGCHCFRKNRLNLHPLLLLLAWKVKRKKKTSTSVEYREKGEWK